MGDFIRFIPTSTHNLTLEVVENGLKATDPEFSILVDQAAPSSGDVLLGGELFGEVELNLPQDQVFLEDIEDLRDQLTDIPDDEKAVVVQALAAASGMIARIESRNSSVEALWLSNSSCSSSTATPSSNMKFPWVSMQPLGLPVVPLV